MYDFSLLIYFISLGILWSQPLCKGATHWIVTEDGRIQQQVTTTLKQLPAKLFTNFSLNE